MPIQGYIHAKAVANVVDWLCRFSWMNRSTPQKKSLVYWH